MAIRQVTPSEARELIQQGHRYVDVRTVEEFAGGHPESAVNVPVMHRGAGGMAPNPDFTSVMEKRFPKETPLVLGCQSGMRSQRAAEILQQSGYQDVVNMQGGFGGARSPSGEPVPGWSQSGLPVCRDCGHENTYEGMKGG